MSLEILEKIGLTKSEIKVYLALLELGSSTTGPIVDKSGASSSKIYEILDRLIHKGMASHVMKGATKYFEAAPPERILDYLKEKEDELSQQKKQVEELLPQLHLKKEMAKYKQEATIYRGMRGIETAFYDALKLMKKGETFYVYGIPSRSDTVNYFFVKWNRERAKKGVKGKQLLNESARGEFQAMPENNLLSELKFMPKEQVVATGINIFHDRVILFPPESGDEPLAFVIDNKAIAAAFKAQFDLLWEQEVKVYTGLDGHKMILRDMAENATEIFAFGLEDSKLDEHVPEDLKNFTAAMEKRKVPERLLFKEGSKHKFMSKYAKARYLPEAYFGPLHVEIYGNKVAISDWTEPVTTIVLEKKLIADDYRRYFELLWKLAKP